MSTLRIDVTRSEDVEDWLHLTSNHSKHVVVAQRLIMLTMDGSFHQGIPQQTHHSCQWHILQTL